MSVGLEQWRRSISEAWGEAPSAAAWELIVSVALEGGRDVPTAAIARAVGVSTERAAAVLRTIPTTVLLDRRVSRTVVWSLPPGLDAELSASALRAALSAAQRPGARRRSPAERSRRALESLELALHALAHQGPGACARLVRERALAPRELLARVPPKARQDVGEHLALLHAALEMNRGEAMASIRRVDRALARGVRAPAHQVHLLATAAAAARMIGPDALSDSLARYARAESLIEAVGDATARRSLRRWVLASSATPLMLMGDTDSAIRRARQALDLVEGDSSTAATETRLLLGRALRWGGFVRESAEVIASATIAGERSERWIAGWCPRYEADALWCPGDPILEASLRAAWIERVSRAWTLNDGFGFQQRQVLARVAWAGWDPSEGLSSSAARAFALRASSMHRERLGVAPGDCPRCRGASLPERLRHALGVRSATDLLFYR